MDNLYSQLRRWLLRGARGGPLFDQRDQQVSTQYNAARDIIIQQPLLVQDRNRQAMLQKVEQIWIRGYLERSLDRELRIDLGLTEQPQADERYLNTLVHVLDDPTHPSSGGTSMIEVFRESTGSLLILGAPGAGKTSLLLELLRDLLVEATKEDSHPIPVVLNLSSWSQQWQSLAAWLVVELNRVYDLPHAIGKTWIDEDRILLLLDGLDEVAQDARDGCVQAINTFRAARQRAIVPTAVCCRREDYAALTERLRLNTAMLVEPLTDDQVNAFLARDEQRFAALRYLLAVDTDLHNLARTPLLLNVMALTYRDLPAGTIEHSATSTDTITNLWHHYVDRMLRRRQEARRYQSEQTIMWLMSLGGYLIQESQTIFYLDRMQPTWLSPKQRPLVQYGIELGGGLVEGLVGALVGALVVTPFRHLFAGVAFALLLLGLPFGLLFLGVAIRLLGVSNSIAPVDTVRWSRRDAFSTKSLIAGLVGGLRYGLVIGLIMGMIEGLVAGPRTGLKTGLSYAPFFGLIGGLYSFVWNGFITEVSDTISVPGEMIRRAGRYGIVTGLCSGLAGGLLVGLFFRLVHGRLEGLFFGLSFGLLFGLIGGLLKGGRTYLQHKLLHWLLVRNGSIPHDYVRFLDFCVDHIFLRRVGGGYIFIHRMLMEYFADLYSADRSSAVRASATTRPTER